MKNKVANNSACSTNSIYILSYISIVDCESTKMALRRIPAIELKGNTKKRVGQKHQMKEIDSLLRELPKWKEQLQLNSPKRKNIHAPKSFSYCFSNLFGVE